MKTTVTLKVSVPFIFCFACVTAPAQINNSKIELGADLATFVYMGDLTPSKLGSFKTMTLGFDIYGNYKISHRLFLKTKLVLGKLKGDESKYSSPAYRQQRNLKFKTPVTEISESVVWNIVPPATEYGPRLTPYISAGVGYAFLHITRDYSNFNVSYFGQESPITAGLAADTAHSLPRGLMVFPVSAGLRYALTKNLSVNLETTYRFNSSDYLDGFSQSANPNRNDHFFTNAIGVIYNFNKSNAIKCPPVKY